MEFNHFWQLIGRKKQTIFSLMLIAIVLVLVIAVLSPIKYGSQSKILVMQDGLKADTYTLSRTNEYMGNLFSQVMYSSSFYSLVMSNSNYQIDQNYFSGNQAQKMKKWRKNINARVYGDTGIIEINVYHENQRQAGQLALAVNDTLINQAYLYSGNENINIKVIDQPLVSERPVKPNIPYIVVITLIGSFIFSLMYIYIFPEEKYSIKFFKKGNKKKNQETITKEIKNENSEINQKTIINEIKNENSELNQSDQLNEYHRRLANNQDISDISGDIENIVK